MSEEQLQDVSVFLLNSSGERTPATLEVLTVTPGKAFKRGARRSLKIIGTVFLVLLPFAALEPFLFLLWGSAVLLVLFVVVGPILHLHFAGETQSFRSISGRCPYCACPDQLKPYISTRFEERFTVLCQACGQTVQVTSI